MLFFLGIAVIGAFVLGMSILVGDSDIDTGDMETDTGSDLSSDPSVLSLKTVSLFMVGAGSAGAVLSLYVENVLLTSLVGAAIGVGFSIGGYQLLKVVYRQQASSLVEDTDFLARPAQVTVAIPPKGVGQVGFEVRGKRLYRKAREKSGASVAEGLHVHITDIDGSVLVVERLDHAKHELKED